MNPEPETRALRRRRTHKYQGGWAYEDEWDQIGTYRVAVQGSESDGSIDDYRDTIMLVDVELNDHETPQDEVARALHDTLGGSSCTHEHDCCGCVSTSVVDVHEVGDASGRWMVWCTSSRNY